MPMRLGWSPSTRAGLLGTGAMLPCPSWSDTHMVRFESSEALAVLPAVARTAVELHGCCARVSLAEALLSQHIDGVARAGSAGTKSGSSARSLVLLTMLAPVVENRTVRGSARARRRSELANRRRRCHGQPPSGWHLRRRFANFQSVSAVLARSS